MRAAALLVRADEVAAEDSLILGALADGDEDVVAGREPVRERRLARHVARQRVVLAAADHRLERRPDTVRVSGGSRPDHL
jgi:hypothetical protein